MNASRSPDERENECAHSAEFDHPTRGRSYGHANDELPSVREAEIDATLQALGPRRGECILEFGAGNGLLTRKIVPALQGGDVVALDNSKSVLAMLGANLPTVKPILLNSEISLPLESSAFDAVVSLANFHHVSQRTALLEEFSRVIKPGGRIVIADVEAGSDVARYFDEVVDAICSTGHKHLFVDRAAMCGLAEAAGLRISSWQVRSVPWVFDASCNVRFATAEEMAGWYLRTIHDASVDAASCLDLASRYLPIRKSEAVLTLQWTLFFCELRAA